jgi:hypothetical protein
VYWGAGPLVELRIGRVALLAQGGWHHVLSYRDKTWSDYFSGDGVAFMKAGIGLIF